MTEAEATEIVERYETLVAEVVKKHGPFSLPDFDVSFPVEIANHSLVIRENVEGDGWRLRCIVEPLS